MDTSDAFYYCSGFGNGSGSSGGGTGGGPVGPGPGPFGPGFKTEGSTDDLIIGNSVTSIGNYAFYYCSGLTGRLIIPDSVISIGDNAFAGCSGFGELGGNSGTGGSAPGGPSGPGPFGPGFKTEGSTDDLIIGNSVTSIGNYAFAWCYGLTGRLIIPDSVISIGDCAFYECCGFGELVGNDDPGNGGTGGGTGGGPGFDPMIPGKSEVITNDIIIGNSVTSIGSSAFAYCDGLKGSLVIPSSVSNIGNGAFSSCSGLEQIIVDEDNPYYDSRENCNALIETSTNTLITGCKNTIILNTVTSIGDNAFYGCSGLTSIGIPNSVISIGNYAFGYCVGLSLMTVYADNPPALEDYVFDHVNKSIPVYVPCASLETYQGTEGWSEFINTLGLCSGEIAVIANPIEGGMVTGGGYYEGGELCVLTATSNPGFAFVNWTENGTVVSTDTVYSFPAHPTTIVANFCSDSPIVFADANVKALCVANWDKNGDGELSYAEAAAVTSLEEVFKNNSSITSFDELQYFIGLTSVGNSAFNWCTALTSVVIPNSVNSIGSFAFNNCYCLTSVIIPNSVTSIGEHSFSYCNVLTSMIIPNSVTSIGNSAFSNCRGLTSVIIPNSVTSIGNYAFYYCSGLTSVIIPDSVTTIGSYAFYYCTSLTSVTIGNSVTSIGDRAFYNCSGLTSMTILADNPPTLEKSSYSTTYYNFYNVDKSIPVYVPCGAKNAYQNASGWNEFTNIRELCTQTQTTALAYGWNWYSTYIEQEGIDGLGQLENSIGIPNVRIESKDGDYVRSKVRNGRTVWVGALTSINNEEMYKIGTKTACEATMEGIAADPADHPITINRGWNWIGFPCDHSVSVSEALSGFSPKKNDMIKGRNGSATYNNGTWSGTLNTLEPGQGYMYGSKSNVTKTLVFQTGSRGEATLANITPENNYYQPAEDYADNMTVIAVVELDGEELRSEAYELAAFAGDECRGSVKLMYVESLNRYMAFLTVFGDEAEDLHFVLTDGATSDLSADRMIYATDGIEGTLDEPVVLRFGFTNVNENASVNVRVYPNPSQGIFNIEGSNIKRVEVFNALGQPVCSMETENGFLKLDLTNRPSGVYLIRVVTADGVKSHQVMKR